MTTSDARDAEFGDAASGPDGRVTATRQGALVTITIERPAKRNALSSHIQQQLAVTLSELADDPTIGVAVLTGAGDRAFAAGGDLVALSKIRTAEGARAMATKSRSVLDQIRRFPVPVVAVVNGDAYGGGAELAMACDFRVLAGHARLAFVQGRQAISCAWGGGVDLIWLVGAARALRWLCSCEFIAHADGLAAGLYDRCTTGDEVFAEVVDGFVGGMLELPPHVLRTYKAMAIADRMDEHRARLESVELERFVGNWVHEDHWRALDAFLQRERATR